MHDVSLELDRFRSRVASTEAERNRVFELRYDVYCHEFGYLDPIKYVDGREQDDFDANALQVYVLDGEDDLAACVRLVLPSSSSFPTQNHFEQIGRLEWADVGELSRLIVATEHRRNSRSILMILAVGLYHESLKHGLRGWTCAMVIPTWKLFRQMGMPFRIAGEVSLWSGASCHPVIPAYLDFAEAAIYLKGCHSEVYRLFVPADHSDLSEDERMALPRICQCLQEEGGLLREQISQARNGLHVSQHCC